MIKNDFYKIFQRHYQELCRFAFIIVNCKQTADEVVQKSFISFWENRNSVQINRDVKSYLFKSVKNIAINHVKSSRIRKNYEQEYSEQKKTHSETDIDNQFFVKKLKGAITKLPDRCRMVYCLRYVEGLSYKEIANYLEISINTVDNHIQKALKLLKKELVAYKAEIYNN